MEQRVKIFSSEGYLQIEGMINDFLKNNDVEVMSITMNVFYAERQYNYFATLLYKK